MYAFTDYVSPAEAALIQEITDLTLEKQRKRHKPGELAERDVHKKELITLRIILRVLDTMPAFAASGLFAQAATYEGVMRFSNGAFGKHFWDAGPNIRGGALKIFGVGGAKLLPGDEDSTEFDIIMANHETFFASSLDQMLLMAKNDFLALAAHHPETLLNISASMFKYVSSLLTTSFYSQGPYQLGDVACKYALLPAPANNSHLYPNLFRTNYLHDQAVARLTQGPAHFTLCVQIHRAGESIEDSTKSWKGAFIPVAELEIPQLDPRMPMLSGEALSFNPWRVLAANQPLSWIGRLRRPVYASDFAWRTRENLDNTT